MQWLAELSVRRPVFGTVIVLSLVVVGAFSYFRLGVDLFPKVDFPSVSITTRQTGAAPEEIETDITDKIERAVNTIAGIDELRSVSTEGVSQVFERRPPPPGEAASPVMHGARERVRGLRVAHLPVTAARQRLGEHAAQLAGGRFLGVEQIAEAMV